MFGPGDRVLLSIRQMIASTMLHFSTDGWEMPILETAIAALKLAHWEPLSIRMV